MSYRIAKKTTKITEYKCLSCKHHKLVEKTKYYCYIKCNAENKCIVDEFDCKYFYCVEHKSFNDMSKTEQAELLKKQREAEDNKNYKAYLNKYYSKKEAKALLEKRNDRKK